MPDTCACVSPIVELHDFFAAWYRGDAGADIALMESALAPEFRLITPKATVIDRTSIMQATVDQRGSHPEARIEIRPTVCTQARGLHLSSYEEWQFDDVDRPARLSTAVLSTTDGGWRWHLVHETWLEQGTSAD